MVTFENIDAVKKYFTELRLVHSNVWNEKNLGLGIWWHENENKVPLPVNTNESHVPRLSLDGTARCIFTAHNISIDGKAKTVMLYDGFEEETPVTFIAICNGNSTALIAAEIIPIVKWTFIDFTEEDDEPQYFTEII